MAVKTVGSYPWLSLGLHPLQLPLSISLTYMLLPTSELLNTLVLLPWWASCHVWQSPFFYPPSSEWRALPQKGFGHPSWGGRAHRPPCYYCPSSPAAYPHGSHRHLWSSPDLLPVDCQLHDHGGHASLVYLYIPSTCHFVGNQLVFGVVKDVGKFKA